MTGGGIDPARQGWARPLIGVIGACDDPHSPTSDDFPGISRFVAARIALRDKAPRAASYTTGWDTASIRDQALPKVAHVNCGHVLKIEPFAEAGHSFLRKAHAVRRDFSRGMIRYISRYGPKPVSAIMDFRQEIQLGAGQYGTYGVRAKAAYNILPIKAKNN